MAYLELRNISKNFTNVVAVQDFSLDIKKGSLVSFLGPSGCGKTTTLRMIAGFEQPDNGTIELDGCDITIVQPNQRDIGMVFQSYALFPNMTVHENVAFGLQMKKKSREEIEKRVTEVLEMVRLQDTAKRYPHQLSGGQQQRIALARALAVQPRVLLLDEPLSALDAEVRIVLRGEIRRIQSELAITTVYVTHDQEEALSISDKVVVMDKGLIQQVGTPEEIYRAPQNRFVATFIGTANQFFGKISGKDNVICENVKLITGPLKDFRQGQKVVVLVRPENIQIQSEKPSHTSSNIVEGVVETIIFHGAVTRIGLNASDQRIVADITVSSKTQVVLNQRVWLLFPSNSCQVMPIDA
jgi:putative spermidine/putrescine transport system ATP-binding protein